MRDLEAHTEARGASRAPYSDGWLHPRRRKIRGGDLVVVLAGGAIVVGLVVLNLTTYENLQEARRSEQMAWGQANGLEEDLAKLLEDRPGRGRAERWASVIGAPGARPVVMAGAADGPWGWGVHDPEAGRVLLVFGGLPLGDGALVLGVGTQGAVEPLGALDVDERGRAVVCLDGRATGEVVQVLRGDGGDAEVLLGGTL